jgi:integrase
MKRLTDDVVRKLALPAKGIARVWDAPDPKGKKLFVAGFGVRLSAGGMRSFVLRYRNKQTRQARMFTIGPFDVWSVEAARDEALDLKRRIARDGADPLEEKQTARDAPTVSMLCDRFIAEHCPKKRPKTAEGYQRIIEKHIKPDIGRKLVAAITDHDIQKIHDRITKDGHAHNANRTIAVASRMFTLAVKWRMRPDNPCKGIERNPEGKRVRYLTADELARLTDALAAHEDQQAANVFRLLLLTGARRGEVLSATWHQFDFHRNVWIKPDHQTKQRKEHEVPLGDQALALLHAMRKAGPDNEVFLFPSRTGAAGGHRTQVKKGWRAICQRARIKNLRIHDLRHSYASVLVSAGFSLPVIGAMLGHSNPVTTARYAHLMNNPLREAANKAGALMPGLVAKRPTKPKRLKVVAGGKR